MLYDPQNVFGGQWICSIHHKNLLFGSTNDILRSIEYFPGIKEHALSALEHAVWFMEHDLYFTEHVPRAIEHNLWAIENVQSGQ